MTSNKLEEVKENIFMGEDMNAKVPFQDCIEVQFSENGNIEYFKLKKNLTRLAAEKNEIEMVEIIKNFEYSISQLNQALNLSIKKEFSNISMQTESQKPILLTFMKQLLADFESYDGGENERREIEEEIKDYNESEFLNLEVTKLKSSNERAMTMKELMFSFFEYAKQKAISLSYHFSEEQRNIENADDDSNSNKKKTVDLNKNRRDEPNDYFKDSSRSIHMNLASKYIGEGSDSVRDNPYNPLLDKSLDEINKNKPPSEDGKRPHKNKTKFMLPLMEEHDENITESISSKERRKPGSKLSVKMDKVNTISPAMRSSRKGISKKDFGCQNISYGIDEGTMTLEATQAEELARMIKIEAQKTIQMLEMFMNTNNSNLAILNETVPSINEIQQKSNADLMMNVNTANAITQDDINSSEDEMDYPHDEDLFSGMDTQYGKYGSFIGNKYNLQEKKVPFSKYVEEAMK